MLPIVAKESIDQGTSPASDKTSRNKRKFRADTPTDLSKSFSSALDDLPPYEFSSENSGAIYHGQNVACDMCGSSQDHCSDSELSGHIITESSQMHPFDDTQEFESGDSKDADWSELTEAQLEELLLSNLSAIFTSAIKKIATFGYSEEDATKSIMRTGISHGFKDAMSNILENAIAFLTTCQQTDSSKESYFDDLQQLGRYILAEMVCVLRALRPSLSSGDAMWNLLICDLNISEACTMDGETSTFNNTGNTGPSNEKSSMPTDNHLDTELKISESEISDPCKSSASTPSLSSEALCVSAPLSINQPKQSSVLNKVASEKKNNLNMIGPDKSLNISGSSQMLASEGKINTSWKGHHSNSSKRELLPVQKTLHLDKGSRAVGYKGGLKPGKIGRLAGVIFDRKLKYMAQSSSMHHRNVSAKTGKAVGVKFPQEHEKLKQASDQPNTIKDVRHDSDSLNVPAILANKNNIPPPPLPTVNKPASIPGAETGTKNSQEPASDRTGVLGSNFAESMLSKPFQQFSGSEARDSVISKLTPRVHELQSELEMWTEWANQKIMQAARRLGKDKSELKSLRQERDEVEKLIKDKQTIEENTMKKLSEMENALRKTTGQVERTNSAFRRLEVETAALRQQMEASTFQSAESATSCREASNREKKTLMELQSWEKQKTLFQEELINENRKYVQVQKELAQAKEIMVQVEARLDKEIKVNEDLKARTSLIQKEVEKAEAMVKTKEEVTKLKAESSLHKYKADIQNLETEISQLRLNKDSSKIAALRRGTDEGGYTIKQTDSLNDFPADNAAKNSQPHQTTSVKRNRECVMCLSEEMSVVFMPCAHQVVCSKCNELHEKKGMKECPSCRSLIERRIAVRYAVS